MTRRGQGQDTETKHHHSMKQQNQQCIQHCSHCHVHSTYTYSITNICCCLCSLSVTPQIDMSNQLCLCKYNKECGVESVIYSAIWFRSNLFYSAFFGRISVNLFGMPVPDIPWGHPVWLIIFASFLNWIESRVLVAETFKAPWLWYGTGLLVKYKLYLQELGADPRWHPC